jgi:hypothetical protein
MTTPLRVGMVDRLSPIDRNQDATATSETKKAEQTKDAAACASGGAIGDNGSTLYDTAA